MNVARRYPSLVAGSELPVSGRWALIRLMRMGLEVLETGELRVRRDDADELSGIRDGAMSFDELLSAATALQESMEAASATTRLPADVDQDTVDALLVGLLLEGSR
jgi:uncharacterized protein